MGRKRLQLGDIIEIKTTRGLAYAQFTHHIPRFGAVVRVFDKFADERIENLSEVKNREIRFTTLLPLQAMVTKKMVEIVGNVSIREELAVRPIFRSADIDLAPGKKSLWLWDGKNEWPATRDELSGAQLPLCSVWNGTLFIERVESGWRDGDDLKSRLS